MTAKTTSVRVRPKQSLGQNFLVDDNISRKIANAIHLQSSDVVLEVGAGQGALTRQLAGKSKHLIIVEIDGRVVDRLREEFVSPGVTVLHADILDISFREWSERFGKRIRVVGNIPYHLTSPILFKAFDEHHAVSDVTIMIQREVAQRLVAVPGTKEYGIPSVLAQFYGIVEMLFNVSPNCFYPKPKVTSTVLQLRMHERLPFSVNEALLRTVVKTTFGKRRKTIRNSLQYLPFAEEMIARIIAREDFPLERRAEQLSVEEFVHLTQSIEEMQS